MYPSPAGTGVSCYERKESEPRNTPTTLRQYKVHLMLTQIPSQPHQIHLQLLGTMMSRALFVVTLMTFAASQAGAVPGMKMPTKKPLTKMPTKKPLTKLPTKKPLTKMPTKKPLTKMPTKQPLTKMPTKKPVTKMPTKQPVTKLPTKKPHTMVPTKTSASKLPTKNHLE